VTRVILIEDHASFRESLAFMLDREGDLEVVGQAGSHAEALGLVTTPCDVALVDLNLPDGSGAVLARELRSNQPELAVVVLSASSDQEQIAQAIENGAVGIINKACAIPEIIEGIRSAAQGDHLVSGPETMALVRGASRRREAEQRAQDILARLTPRERDVLGALSRGQSDKQIAAELHMGTETVRTHMANILGKLGVDSRLQAVVFAFRHGAVDLE
jgi:DNA-binding NarL/FixJ family response regulator